MTYDYGAVCTVDEALAFQGRAGLVLGGANTLVAALLQQGRCTLTGGADAGGLLPAAAGQIVVAAGPLTLEPAGECAGCALVLTGSAAAQLAGQVPTPLALPAERHAGIQAALLGLAETHGRLAAPELSAAAYALVCRIAASGGARALPALVSAAIDEIQEHYAEVYGVEELAESLQVSKSHLIRSFTAAVGIPPGRYLVAVRVEAAKRLLVQGGFSLEVIASLCGFSGANYLCKVFKAHTGETPAAWRRRAAPGSAAAAPVPEWEEQLYL